MDVQPRKNRMMRAAGALAILVLLTSSAITGNYARHAIRDRDDDSARTAAFVLSVGSEESFDLPIEKPGDACEFDFTVKNHDETISEVDMRYTLNVDLMGNMPLVCSLKRGDVLVAEKGTGDEDTLTGSYTFLLDSETYEFSAATASEANWTLQVRWPADRNSFEYSQGGLAKITLTVTAEQID